MLLLPPIPSGIRSAPGLHVTKWIRPFALVIWIAACRAPATERPADTVGAQEVERGAFVLVARGDTTVRDEYTRTSALLEGEVRTLVSGAKFRTARYRVWFREDGTASRAELTFPREQPTSSPPTQFTATFSDSVIEERQPGRPPLTAKGAPGVVPLFAPSIAMLQNVISSSHSGGHREVLVYPIATDGRPQSVSVRRVSADTVEVTQGGSSARYAVDDRGRITGGRSANGEFATIRIR